MNIPNVSNVWHVYPIDDLYPHDTENWDACICCPAVEIPKIAGDGYLVLHNSFDGREERE